MVYRPKQGEGEKRGLKAQEANERGKSEGYKGNIHSAELRQKEEVYEHRKESAYAFSKGKEEFVQ